MSIVKSNFGTDNTIIGSNCLQNTKIAEELLIKYAFIFNKI